MSYGPPANTSDLVVKNDKEFVFRKTVSAAFDPKEDITAYELAKCLFMIHGQHFFEDEWDSLGSWTRHFRRV